MDAFDRFVHEWGLVIIFASIYSVMKYGGRNRKKYKEWDRRRAKWAKEKEKR